MVSPFSSDTQQPDLLAGTGKGSCTVWGGAKGGHLTGTSNLGHERMCVTNTPNAL